MTQNDCLHRARFTARWLIFTDIDEYIFTPPPASLSSSLAALARANHAWASIGAYWGFISRCRQKVQDDASSNSSTSTSSGGSGTRSSTVATATTTPGTSRSSRELTETGVAHEGAPREEVPREEVRGYEAQGLVEKELLIEYLPMRSRLPICSSVNFSETSTINKTKAFFCPEHFGRRKVVLDPRRVDQVTVHEVLLPGSATGEVWNASYEAGMPVLMHFRGLLNQEKMPRCVRVRVEETVGSREEGEQLNVIDFTFSDYVQRVLAAVPRTVG
ncbi:hypothetical protein CLOM_g12676 [Closterium sp. NIES-68]|nr:hypothetical protein CLOM_g12676 [Closterium sp. NIES-68]GJP82778.1 hypothetical protein CLOP_g13012 [Closterium sp. NIES-67]